MVARIRGAFRGYPGQFWLIFLGALITSSGGNLVWPFMSIYLHQRLGISLTTVGLLLGLISVTSLFSQAIAGPLIDRFGRKMAMMVSMATSTLIWVGYGFSNSLGAFAVLAFASEWVAWFLRPAG